MSFLQPNHILTLTGCLKIKYTWSYRKRIIQNVKKLNSVSIRLFLFSASHTLSFCMCVFHILFWTLFLLWLCMYFLISRKRMRHHFIWYLSYALLWQLIISNKFLCFLPSTHHPLSISSSSMCGGGGGEENPSSQS